MGLNIKRTEDALNIAQDVLVETLNALGAGMVPLRQAEAMIMGAGKLIEACKTQIALGVMLPPPNGQRWNLSALPPTETGS